MSQHTGLQGIWEDLRSCISVSAEICEEENSQDGLPIEIRFVVTNNSSGVVPEGFEIILKSIELEAGIPQDFHTENCQALKNEESFSYVYKCRYEDIPLVKYKVRMTSVPEFTLKIETDECGIPVTSGRHGGQISIAGYISAIQRLKIFEQLISILNQIKIPDTDTTLGQIEQEQNKIDVTLNDLREWELQLEGVFKYIQKNDEINRFHQQVVNGFFSQIRKVIGEFSQTFRTHDAVRIANVRENSIAKISDQAKIFKDAAARYVPHKNPTHEQNSTNIKPVSNPVMRKNEIDLHGMTVPDALVHVDAFLQDCVKANESTIWIIHGKGTGVLREEVSKYLSSHALVDSFSEADSQHGKEGATQVILRLN